MIYCDDLGYGDLGCYGSETCRTPHVDALAEDGLRFTDWYSNSPVCSPSRAALMTGKHPGNTGVTSILGGKRKTAGLPASETTLARALQGAGYRTALYGKWHLGMVEENSPNAHGFDEFFGFKAGCVDFYSHIFYWEQAGGVNPVHDLWHNETEVWENGRYLTELITEKAVEFIERSGEEPFFLYLPYNAPHYPMHAPKAYMDRFAHLPWDRQVMAAMIAAVDDGVGAIVDTLKKHGLYEDTVIFFSADNGPSTESRNWLDGTEDLYYGGSAGIFRGHKGSLFDGGIREPAILACPGRLEGGRVVGEPYAMMDIFPTFLRLAGIEPDRIGANGCKEEGGKADGSKLEGSKVDGMDIMPFLTGAAPAPQDRTLFWEYNDQLAARSGTWKLVLNGKLDFSRESPDAVHLSDLAADPGERTNLAEAHPELVSRLSAEARAWAAGLGRS